MKPTLLLSGMVVLCLGLSAGCNKKEEAGGSSGGGKAKGGYSCFVQVARKATPVEGRAEGPDEAKVEEEAWKAACDKLAEADRPNCKNPEKFAASTMGGSVSAGGPVNYSKTVQLNAKNPAFRGDARSETSEDEACKAALAHACEKAGSPGDCLAAGFEKVGEGSSHETVGF